MLDRCVSSQRPPELCRLALNSTAPPGPQDSHFVSASQVSCAAQGHLPNERVLGVKSSLFTYSHHLLGEATLCLEVGVAAAAGHGDARGPHAKVLANLAQAPVARTPDEVEEGVGRFQSQGSSHAFRSTRHGR